MNDQLKALIDQAQTLLAAGTPRPWGTGVHVGEPRALCRTPQGLESLLGLDRDGMAICASAADAPLITFAVNNLDTLCEAVKELERRLHLTKKVVEIRTDSNHAWAAENASLLAERDALRVERDQLRKDWDNVLDAALAVAETLGLAPEGRFVAEEWLAEVQDRGNALAGALRTIGTQPAGERAACPRCGGNRTVRNDDAGGGA